MKNPISVGIKVGSELVDLATQKGEKELRKAFSKQEAMKLYRKEATRLVSMANKRVKRLENKGFTESPAYKGLEATGSTRFSVKNKTFNELQSEVARMKAFLNANTSTVRGVNTYLKEMASNTGMNYKNMSDLMKKAPKFFELSSKVEQYLRNIHDIASAFSSTRIWDEINTYVKDNSISLDDESIQLEEMIEIISERLADMDMETNAYTPSSNWFKMDS